MNFKTGLVTAVRRVLAIRLGKGRLPDCQCCWLPAAPQASAHWQPEGMGRSPPNWTCRRDLAHGSRSGLGGSPRRDHRPAEVGGRLPSAVVMCSRRLASKLHRQKGLLRGSRAGVTSGLGHYHAREVRNYAGEPNYLLKLFTSIDSEYARKPADASDPVGGAATCVTAALKSMSRTRRGFFFCYAAERARARGLVSGCAQSKYHQCGDQAASQGNCAISCPRGCCEAARAAICQGGQVCRPPGGKIY